MKKLALAVLGMMLYIPRPAFALPVYQELTDSQNYSFRKLYEDVRDQTKLTVLKNANPAYFYDLQLGNDKSSQGGVIDHVVTYRFISLDLGWRDTLAGGTGTGVFGPSLRIDKAITLAFPDTVALLKGTFLPESAQKFWDALFVGIDEGWDFDNLKPRGALHAGIAFEW